MTVSILAGSAAVLAATVAPEPAGGGAFDSGPSDHMTAEQRQEIWERLSQNRAALIAEGKLQAGTRGTPPQLIFPLRTTNGLSVNEFYGISGFVDQDPTCPDAILDYNCGLRTYDRVDGPGCYNHSGVDYFLWPFAFLWMDNDQVEIVAAARGTIIGVDDGNFDKSCDWVSHPFWNAVYIEHDDGSVAWYGHMKSGSPTTKGVGQTVEAGEYLGIVGSSGVSNWPHLHFELYDSLGSLQEPHFIPGQCNTMNTFSWWETQRPYRDSKVSLLTAGKVAPYANDCPNTESPNIEVNFAPGDPFYVTAYYRDQLTGMQTQYVLRRPDGTVANTWGQTSGFDYDASWWWWNGSWGGADPLGIWQFEATFNGQTYTTPLRLGGKNASGAVESLTVTRSGTDDVELNWEASCLSTDTDYGVYEGEIGNFAVHNQKTCSTGTMTTYTLSPDFDAAYFLVVPNNSFREGSYGESDAPGGRPQGVPPCRAREAGLCPPF